MTYARTGDVVSVRSYLDAGLQAHHSGRLQDAAAAYRQALLLAPEDGAALNLLGTALLQLGHTEDAVSCLARAARKQRGNAALWGNLGQGYMALGQHGEALESFRKASRIEPNHAQFHVGIAAALALQGKLSEAETLLRRLASRFPKAALVWFNLGCVCRDQNNLEDAISAYRRALQLDPNMIEARNGIGSALHTLLRFSEAEAEYRACIEAAPDYLAARYNLASVTMDLGRFTEAEVICREIVARAPDVPSAHRLLGSALGLQSRLLEAFACYEHAAQLAPEDPQVAQTYGAALMETGRTAAGLRWLARAIRLAPESLPLRQVVGSSLLAAGYIQDGWIEYVTRPAALEFRESCRALAPLKTLHKALAGKHVHVLSEQGLGDALFFLRYARVLAARGARVTYNAPRKICSLLARVQCIADVQPETAPLPRADIYILAGDLPHALGKLESSVVSARTLPVVAQLIPEYPRRTAIFWPSLEPSLAIVPLQEKIAQLRQQLSVCGPPPYIGVTWRAGTAPEKQQTETWLLYKAIGLQGLAAAIESAPGTIVALQRKPAAGEIASLSTALGRTVHDFTAYNDDLEGMLALLALLDDYVGVSNTNMHLRAAVGKTARVLVPAPAEWRWMQTGRGSPWFPGFTIYRQSLRGDWSGALEALKRDLAANFAAAGYSNRP
jgi:tetratricopeptide (TPR) repeat protein